MPPLRSPHCPRRRVVLPCAPSCLPPINTDVQLWKQAIPDVHSVVSVASMLRCRDVRTRLPGRRCSSTYHLLKPSLFWWERLGCCHLQVLSRSPWPPAAAEPLMEAHDRVHEIPAAAFFSSCMIFTSSHAGPSTMLPVFDGEHLHAFLSALTTLLHAAFACVIYVYMPHLHILNHASAISLFKILLRLF